MIEVGLVPSCWNDPGVSAEFAPTHFASLVPASCRQQNEPEQGPVHRIVGGSLPDCSKLIIAQYSGSCLFFASAHSSDKRRPEIVTPRCMEVHNSVDDA